MTPDQFIAFYTLWQPQILRYFRWKGQYQDAEDLNQDLFTSLCLYSNRLRLDTANRYMWVTARRLATNARDRDFHLPITFDPSPDPDVYSSNAGGLFRIVERQTALESHEQAAVDTDAVTGRLAILPDRERQIIIANVLDSYTLAELALTAGVSASRIGQIRDRGLQRLRTPRRGRR